MSETKGKTPTDASACIRADALGITYRTGFLGRHSVRGVGDVSFECPAGSLTAVVGPNGSGKSSILRCVAHLVAATEGDLHVLGCKPGARELRGRIGVVFEGRLPLGRLSGREYLELAGHVAGLDRAAARERAAELLRLLELEHAANRAHDQWSTGMGRRLAFAEALVHEPELLVLDEPGSGLDPVALDILGESLDRHRRAGRTALVATHALDALGAELFDHVLVLHEGRLVARGAPDEILSDESEYEVLWSNLSDVARDEMRSHGERSGARVLREGPRRLRLAELLRRSDSSET